MYVCVFTVYRERKPYIKGQILGSRSHTCSVCVSVCVYGMQSLWYAELTCIPDRVCVGVCVCLCAWRDCQNEN